MLRGKVASIPPAVICGIYALVIFVTYIVQPSLERPTLILALMWAGLAVLTQIWCFDLIGLANTMRGRKPPVWLVVLCVISILASILILPWSILEPADERLGIGSFAAIVVSLLVLYFAAASLVRAERDIGESKHGTILTVIQIAYLVVGVWFLYPRVERLRAAPGD